ncbi:MAG TPA: hypothetical protein VF502_02020, partial [Stellaceae bacterium]
MSTVQANVRVAAGDKPLIVMIAARLRSDAGFRDKLAAILEDREGPELLDRVKKLEEQVSWLLSGAIVVPRTAAPRPIAAPPKAGPAGSRPK